MAQKPTIFSTLPSVYAVDQNYVIIVPVEEPCVMWVRVGDEDFFDDANGVLRSRILTHKMTVPMALLDEKQKYTVCWRKIIDRKAYFSVTGEVEEYESSFRPVPLDQEKINLYHIADTHSRTETPILAGGYFQRIGEPLDLLILNGDIPEDSGNPARFQAIHQIASGITHGEIPVVFSRGNHDNRGVYAEEFALHTPTSESGLPYYTFRLGPIWGLVLDAGEDKPDEHEAYGHTTCFANYRRRETRWLEEVCDKALPDFENEKIQYRLVISHLSLTQRRFSPFDIEQELFAHWARILREKVKPHLMLCGHAHECYISYPGDDNDALGNPCPVVVASKPGVKPDTSFIGGAVTLNKNLAEIKFTDDSGSVLGSETIQL